jgi:ABC-type Zn uptake system ZnuABC Zn-binding protein ZnuA
MLQIKPPQMSICGRRPNLYMFLLLLLLMSGCTRPHIEPSPQESTGIAALARDAEHSHESNVEHETELPELQPIQLGAGEKLRVVATLNIIADIVQQIGGNRIELATLMPPGVDAHSYAATPQDVRAMNDAHVIFVNGLNLEEVLLPVLETLDSDAPVISVNIGVETIEFGSEEEAHRGEGEEGEHHHEGADPHTWQRVHNVQQWTYVIEEGLSALDPAHAQMYAEAAEELRFALEELDRDIHRIVETVPPEHRKLATDHDNLSYFAVEYGFMVVGSVIPGFSTMTSASAQELAALQDQMIREGIKAVFVGSTVNPGLAGQLASDLGIRVVPLYTDSLSDADGPAATYIAMMRYNATAIAEALR